MGRRRRMMLTGVLGGGQQIAVADRYVNTVTGSDSNNGLTPNTAKLTFLAAKSALDAGGGGTIAIYAPASNPLTLDGGAGGANVFATGTWTITPTIVGQTWYAQGNLYRYTSGWTDDGGGVYHRAAQSTRAYVLVETLTDDNGGVLPLAQNASTPTTPAAGEFGLTGGVLYVHLPADASANAHTILHPTNKNPIYMVASGSAPVVTVRNANIRYAFWAIVEVNAGAIGATLNLLNCELMYASSSVVMCSNSSAGGESVINATNVTARHAHDNDGFNLHDAGTATLTNCVAEYCYDEGISPHETYILNAADSRVSYAGCGGWTAVHSAQMHLTRCQAMSCGQRHLAGGTDNGGFVFTESTSGSLTDCEARDNWGSGYYNATSGTVTVANLISGIANGNTEADVT